MWRKENKINFKELIINTLIKELIYLEYMIHT